MNTLDSIKKELDNAEVSMNTGATGEMDYVWYYLASAFIKIFLVLWMKLLIDHK